MFDFTLIIPTYGRDKEVGELLDSLTKVDYDTSRIEIIIIDQNDKISLDKIIKPFEQVLHIKYQKTAIKGISHAKNLGIQLSKASIVTFADDDMLYYSDTFQKVKKHYEETDCCTVGGRLYDREKSRTIIRKFPNKKMKMGYSNMLHTYTAVLFFTTRKDFKFDVNFGAGTRYGVGEEWDHLVQYFRAGIYPCYTPEIEAWHPDTSVLTMTKEKSYHYAFGYGAFTRKNMNIQLILLLLLSLGFQLASLMVNIIKMNKDVVQKRVAAIKGRVIGFFSYKPIHD